MTVYSHLVPASISSSSLDFLVGHDLYLFPLHSIGTSGVCTCFQGSECTSPGKHPLLRYNWKRVATNKPEQIRGWLEKPNVNWGVPTGRKSERTGKFLIVLDMDAPDPELLSIMPRTFSYQTGSEFGRHFWFWSKYPINNSVKKIAPNTDVRGVGGYVVIPPSRHRSGRNYKAVSWSEEIADLTHEIYSRLFSIRESRKQQTSGKKSKISGGKDKNGVRSEEQIKTLRSRLEQGEFIPMGARNVTLHRLLSSDRAQGLSKDALLKKALEYRLSCEDSGSVSDWELQTLVSSVIRYRQGQNHLPITRCDSYFDWLESNKKSLLSEEDKTRIRLSDTSFFSLLKPDSSARTSLTEILRLHDEYARNIHKLQKYARYSLVALSSKLRNMGFCRIRACSANYWNIDLKELKICLECVMLESTMSSTNTPAVDPTTSNPSVPDKEPETFKVKVKNKYHPNDDKYVERSTYESNSAWTKLLTVCSPEQMEALMDRKLILEPEDTDAFLAETQPGDIIGYAHARENEVMYTGRITVINCEAGCIVGEDLSKRPNTVILSKSDLSIALATGFLEILYRDKKPYGIPEETEVEVRIHRHTSETKEGKTPAESSPSENSKEPEVVP